MNIKRKWKLLTFTSILLSVIYLISHGIINMKEESFIPLPEELTASDDQFLYLKTFNESRLQLNIPGESHLLHFLEGYGHSKLTNRNWCAVESACLMNNQAKVVIHMKSGRLFLSPAALNILKNYQNIHIVALEEEDLFLESVLSRFYAERIWEKSRWPISHYNDILRWLILNRYGGIYLDLDSISLRPLTPPSFKLENFTGLESVNWTGAGVIGVSSQNHWLPQSCLEFLASNFDGTQWGANGPKLMTRVLEKSCGLQVPNTSTPLCPNFTVLETNSFYNIPWWEHHQYTDIDKTGDTTASILTNPKVLIAHIWQHLSKNNRIEIHSTKYPTRHNESIEREEGIVNRSKDRDLESSIEKPIRASVTASPVKLQPMEVIARRACPVTLSVTGDYL